MCRCWAEELFCKDRHNIGIVNGDRNKFVGKPHISITVTQIYLKAGIMIERKYCLINMIVKSSAENLQQ